MASTNSTVNLPPGTTDHGQAGLICVPASWLDIVLFFLTNYVAHAATIVTYPGQPMLETTVRIIIAIFIPIASMQRTVPLIINHASTILRDPLRRAVNSGAMITVVKLEDISTLGSAIPASLGRSCSWLFVR
jgi:hypothetical protein